MDLNAKPFIWSKNLFNPLIKNFAFYTDDGFIGWLKPEGRMVWFAERDTLECEKYRDESIKPLLKKEAKAFLQKLTEDFNSY